MKRRVANILFQLLTGLMRMVARLPFWALYALSDVVFVVLYFVVRYRRRVVDKNLTESFPAMSKACLKRVRRQFYRNFADYMFETVKLLHISDEQISRRMTFSGVEIIDEYLRMGRPVVCYFSHTGNWEWAPSITLWSSLQPGYDAEFCQIYRPLRNRRFDALMLRLRSRFGAVSLPKNRAFLDLMRYARRGVPTVTGFMSDQKPSHGDEGYVCEFLNHPTAMITGTETVARRLNAAVVYWDMQKNGRGHYHIDIMLITDTAASMPRDAITAEYARLLEATIRRQPSIWLWSHNRWKHPLKPKA